MSTIYSVGDNDIQSVQKRLSDLKNPKTGESFFTPAVGISLMLFYAFAMQCMTTVAIVYRETKKLEMAGNTVFIYGSNGLFI